VRGPGKAGIQALLSKRHCAHGPCSLRLAPDIGEIAAMAIADDVTD
jgi:hypothetical protein